MALRFAFVVFFGLFLPYGQRLDFLNPWQLFLYTSGPGLFVAGLGVRKAVAAWGVGIAVYVVALGFVSARYWHGRFLLPDFRFAFSATLIGLTLCLAAGTLPRRIVQVAGVAVLVLFVSWPSFAPPALRDSVALLLVSKRLPLYTALLCIPVCTLLIRMSGSVTMKLWLPPRKNV